MSNKVKERRERKIAEAVKAKDWNEVSRLLQQEQNNAERRDRYHKKRSLEENVARKDDKQRERHEVVASSDLTPEESLLQQELKQAIAKAKESLNLKDRDIVEMIAEQGLTYKETSRRISLIHGKISDVTVKAHYLKAIQQLAPLLEDYR